MSGLAGWIFLGGTVLVLLIIDACTKNYPPLREMWAFNRHTTAEGHGTTYDKATGVITCECGRTIAMQRGPK